MTRFWNTNKLLLAKMTILAGYGISIPGLWIMRDNPEVFQLSWVFTTLTLILLMLFHKPFSAKYFISILSVGIIGWTVEAIGTNTGILFGEYSYGPSLGPKFYSTPITMVVNWMISVYLITMVLRPKIVNLWRLGFAGALLMVIYDILLEPVAIRLNMWSWENGTPPLQNYLAWFVISFPLVMLLGNYTKKAENPLALMVLVCQLFFFGFLNLMISFLEM